MSDRRLAELAGATLVVGLPGPRLDADAHRMLEDVRPAGVILFARNVVDEDGTTRLVRDLRAALDDPFVLIDQEGGRVDRLRTWRGRSPSARELAAQGPSAVRAEADRTARDLATLGVDFNCAPVVDLDEGNEGNGLGDRAYGSDPEVVVECAREVLEAHAARGVVTCLKHFPGLGRTRLDSHLARPSVDEELAELEERELVPFRRLARAAPAVMVSHAAFPRVTGSDEAASLSREIVDGLLRRRIGYDGLVVTDDLDMGAVTDVGAPERAVRALGAGCDLLLLCQDFGSPRPVRDALIRAVEDVAIDGARLEDAAARVRATKRARRPIA